MTCKDCFSNPMRLRWHFLTEITYHRTESALSAFSCGWFNLLSLLQVGFSRGPSRSKSQDAKESKKGSGRGWKTTRLRCSPDSKWGTERAGRSGGSILSVMQFCECWQVHWRVCKADSYQRNTHFPSALTHCLGAACGKVGLGANTGRISKRSSWSPWSVTLPKFSDVKRALHGCHRQPPHYFQL